MFAETDGSRKTIGDVDVVYHEGIFHLFHLVLPNHDFIAHADDVESAVLQAKAATAPFVIDAVVSDGELSLPPKIQAEQVVGFAESKAKQVFMALSGDHEQWENIKEELATYFDSGR